MAFQVQTPRDVPGLLTEIIEVIDRLHLRTLAPGEAANWLERLLDEADRLAQTDSIGHGGYRRAVGDLVVTLRTAETQAVEAAALCREARDGA